MWDTKLLGGILLISGTCIGGGMLGLPIATAKGGILNSSLLFLSSWVLMTFTALLTLEVNLCFPKNSNIISMAKATLGTPGLIVSWTVYLLFLYSLVAAYIAGGQDVLQGLFLQVGINLPTWIAGFLFVFIFGFIVAAGIKHVDFFNRLLMLIKLSTVFLLMFLIIKHVHVGYYASGKITYLLPALTVVITSFGFSIVVPSLRTYFNEDILKLRIAIILGSFLPLICYLIWEAVIFGIIPLVGEYGLGRLMESRQPVTSLLQSITYYIPSQYIALLSHLFTSVCVLTAFACVSLGLWDYLADGFNLTHKKGGKYCLTFLTFMPPLCVVIFYPKAFILFLSLGGLFCVLLQAFMPALMAWQCRYISKMNLPYQVVGGKPALLMAMALSLFIVGASGFLFFM